MRDVVVVGGGPAGLATALYARERELAVTVLDRQQPPIDKACGEGIMPSGVDHLRRMDVRIDPESSTWIPGIRYRRGEHVTQARFSRGPALGYRRTALHRALVEGARSRSIDLRWKVRATGLSSRGVQTDRGDLPARWIVGADGLHSRVRSWSNLEASDGRRDRYGITRHYRRSPWTDFVEVYWKDTFEAYVTPVGPDEVSVALLTNRPDPGYDELLERIPRLAEKLRSAPSPGRDRRWGPFYRATRSVRTDRVALVGDAAGYRDAITGEGLSVAFKQARGLAEALAAGDLARYGRHHRRVTRVPFALIEAVLWLKRHPWLVDRMIRWLGDRSWLLARMLDLNDRGLAALVPGRNHA